LAARKGHEVKREVTLGFTRKKTFEAKKYGKCLFGSNAAQGVNFKQNGTCALFYVSPIVWRFFSASVVTVEFYKQKKL
jgi:hypothetical protein